MLLIKLVLMYITLLEHPSFKLLSCMEVYYYQKNSK